MAKEAIFKIKQAEDAGNEEIKKATEQAKLIIKNAEAEGEKQQKEILENAYKSREVMVQQAENDAQKACEPLVKEGNAEIQKIAHPDKQKLEKTVNLIVERIVNGNGCG